jgi:hypothetical protein
VKVLCENRSSRFQVIAFDGNPTWRSTSILDSKYLAILCLTPILDSQISDIECHQHNKNIFHICMSSFLKISEADCKLWYCIQLQYGSRPPSWSFNNANFEVTLRKKVIFSLCVKFCENRSIGSWITAFFRKALWRSAAIFRFFRCNKEKEEFSPCACQIW